jgi:hypothetical protein
VYWIDPAPRGGAAFQVYCDMTTQGGGWTMVFKLTNGLHFDLGDPYTLWSGNTSVNESETGYLNTAANVGHYVNRIVSTYWNRHGYTFGEARVAFYTKGALQPQYFMFDVTGTRREEWFSVGRLIATSYTTLPTAAANYFSIAGDNINSHGRRWFINDVYGGCSVDKGWMVVKAGNSFSPCAWEVGTPNSVYVLISSLTGPVVWNTGGGIAPDVMAVFIR